MYGIEKYLQANGHYAWKWVPSAHVLQATLGELSTLSKEFANKDFSLWKKRSRTLGTMVRIGAIEGIATTIREDGALIVDGNPVLTGDVHLMEGE